MIHIWNSTKMPERKEFHNYKVNVFAPKGETWTIYCRKVEAKDGFLKLKGIENENHHKAISSWTISGFEVEELIVD